MISVILKPLPVSLLPAAVELDQLALGGFWTANGYREELDRDSSDLLGIWPITTQTSSPDLSRSSLHALGCSWSISDETHIILLTVHPDLRRQGLGSAVLLGLLEFARNRGSNYVTLEVRASNRGAIALYEKLGFQSVGRRPRYYSSPKEDALILWRSGLQSSQCSADFEACWQVLQQRFAQANWRLKHPLDPKSASA